MRLLVSVSCVLVMVGCVGPHATGALWAQQNLDQELVIGRQTEAELLAKLHAYELALADESLASERARLSSALQDCPGAARQTMQLSPGDRLRDSIRLRSGDDAQRQAAVAQVALADWRLRRAQATGDAHFCDEARQALSGSVSVESISVDVLSGLGSATVTRDPRHPDIVADQTTPDLTLSNYALGYADTVRARAPLPHYLAAVYGGVLLAIDTQPSLNGQTPEALVDSLAPAYPHWEPDALYAALQPQQ